MAHDINHQLEGIAQDWLTIVSSAEIFIPLIAGLAVGFIISLCPRIRNMKRQSDRAFYIYIANMISSGGFFMAINADRLLPALSMLVLVMGSSVILPAVWFWWRSK